MVVLFGSQFNTHTLVYLFAYYYSDVTPLQRTGGPLGHSRVMSWCAFEVVQPISGRVT